MIYEVYVPTGRTHVAPGSGIVGEPRDHPSDPLLLHFEGNLYNAANIVTFADRCYHAAGRLAQSYPTTARYSPMDDEVLLVGTFDAEQGLVVIDGLGSEEALARWLGTASVPTHELERTH